MLLLREQQEESLNQKALFFIGLAVFAYIHQRQKAQKKRAALWGTALFVVGLVIGRLAL